MSDDMKNYVPDFEHIRRLADGLENQIIAERIRERNASSEWIPGGFLPDLFPERTLILPTDESLWEKYKRDRKDFQ